MTIKSAIDLQAFSLHKHKLANQVNEQGFSKLMENIWAGPRYALQLLFYVYVNVYVTLRFYEDGFESRMVECELNNFSFQKMFLTLILKL